MTNIVSANTAHRLGDDLRDNIAQSDLALPLDASASSTTLALECVMHNVVVVTHA